MLPKLSAHLARRRRAREIDRRLRELDRIDRLDTLPPRARRTPSPGLRTAASLVLTLLLAGLLIGFNPTTSGQQLRDLLGLGGPTVTIGDAQRGSGFTFAMTQPHSARPVTWDPCQPIRYSVNPEGAPPDYDRMVEDAVRDLSAASGFRFEYDGPTDDRDFEDRRPGEPVLIGWATSAEIPELAGDVAGIGGGTSAQDGLGRRVYTTGMVALDRDDFDRLAGAPDGYDRQRAVVEHELGHVLGLGHAGDPHQLMYAETTTQTSLGPGDRRGLRILGEAPCG